MHQLERKDAVIKEQAELLRKWFAKIPSERMSTEDIEGYRRATSMLKPAVKPARTYLFHPKKPPAHATRK